MLLPPGLCSSWQEPQSTTPGVAGGIEYELVCSEKLVNALAPGWIATPLTDGLRNDPARADVILGRTPMARWGTPEDLIGPALFLASSAANFVTGTILNVDGGYAAM